MVLLGFTGFYRAWLKFGWFLLGSTDVSVGIAGLDGGFGGGVAI